MRPTLSDCTSVVKYPHLTFTIKTNLKTGPGAPPLPSDQYIEALEELNSFGNVQTIGNVQILNAQKSNVSVADEIKTLWRVE